MLSNTRVHLKELTMATISTIADDFDGSTPAETVTFSVSGKGYAIDLNEENREKLQALLSEFEEKMAPYVAKARVTGKPAGKTSASTSTSDSGYNAKDVRLWAVENGHTVSERGRIPADVLAAYQKHKR